MSLAQRPFVVVLNQVRFNGTGVNGLYRSALCIIADGRERPRRGVGEGMGRLLGNRCLCLIFTHACVLFDRGRRDAVRLTRHLLVANATKRVS